MNEAFERVRESLAAHGAKFRDVRQNHLMSTCPAHEDKNPSLAVDYKNDRVLMRCHAGCDNEQVIAELGLEFNDLFDGDDPPTAERSIVIRSYLYEDDKGAPWFWVDRGYPKTFRQRLPGTEPGDKTGLHGRPTILYRWPRVKQAIASGETVWLVEGEKDVHAMEAHGLVATTAPMGAGKWEERFSVHLGKAKQVNIIVDQDAVKPDGNLGAGQQHARDARAGLRAQGCKVRLLAPAAGKDAYDHFHAGYGVEDFQPEPTAFTRPRGMRADVLMSTEFPALMYAVHDILPAGLAILAASPKAGKTWLALDFALSVASGGLSLGALSVTQGSVLVLAREDNYRRLQSRLGLLMGGEPAPPSLEVIPSEETWEGGEVGLGNMTEWAEEVGDPRLVVIDTLAKVEPDMGEDRRGGAYTGNYTMMARYKEWADRNNCCVLMIHHDNKTTVVEGESPFNRISGTRGLTGAADTLLFLGTKPKAQRQEGEPDGVLYVTGRDVAEDDIELRKVGPVWQAV